MNLNKIKSGIFKPVEDCGCKKNKAEGFLSNSASRKGIGHPGPLDQGWAAQIRRKGERGKPAAETVLWQGGAPWPAARRSSASGKQGLRATVRRTEGAERERERGGEGDLA